MADSKETRMESISRHLFNLLADIAEDAFRDGQTLTPEALMERLEEEGFLMMGLFPKRSHRHLPIAGAGLFL